VLGCGVLGCFVPVGTRAIPSAEALVECRRTTGIAFRVVRPDVVCDALALVVAAVGFGVGGAPDHSRRFI
jgi:hypothetical protein